MLPRPHGAWLGHRRQSRVSAIEQGPRNNLKLIALTSRALTVAAEGELHGHGWVGRRWKRRTVELEEAPEKP